jgi:hypothetical protein
MFQPGLTFVCASATPAMSDIAIARAITGRATICDL